MLCRVEGTEVFLFGSLHYGEPSFYPLSDHVERAFEGAVQVWFEAMPDETAFRKRARCSNIGMLRKLLFIRKLLKAVEIGDRYGIDRKAVIALKPWALALAIGDKIFESNGYFGKYSLEKHFEPQAKQSGKEVYYLETADDQFQVYDSAPIYQQEEFLDRTLFQEKEDFQEFRETVIAWRDGNFAAFNASVELVIKRHPFFEVLLFERNKKWLPKLKALIDSKIPAFVCVGASHFGGRESIGALLGQKFGCSLQQIKAG